jgi:hypothetical protein
MTNEISTAGCLDPYSLKVISQLASRVVSVHNSDDVVGMQNLTTAFDKLAVVDGFVVVKYRWGYRSRQYIAFVNGRPLASFVAYGDADNPHHFTTRVAKDLIDLAARSRPDYKQHAHAITKWQLIYNACRVIAGELVDNTFWIVAPAPFEDITLKTVRVNQHDHNHQQQSSGTTTAPL